MVLGVLWVLTAAVLAGEEPGEGGPRTNLDAEVMVDEGVLYDPKADYDEGAFSAEEEIAAGAPTIWAMASEEKPAAKDEATGLPIRYIVVDPDEPWHKRCMTERIRGHNDLVCTWLSTNKPAAAPKSEREPEDKRD